MVPVDLSINTEVAVKKALELADLHCIIHLVYVERAGRDFSQRLSRIFHPSSDEPGNIAEVEAKLLQCKNSIQDKDNNITVCTWRIYEGDVQEIIIRKAIQFEIDLIIVGKNSNHSILPFLNTVVPSVVACKTGIPVLTVKPGAIDSDMKTALVPISNNPAYNKMRLLTMMSKKKLASVYLVCFNSHGDEQDCAGVLAQTHQWLRSNLNCSVTLAVLNGNNKAKALLRYAGNIKADFILLASDNETKAGWMNKHISDLISPRSKIQVLSVSSN